MGISEDLPQTQVEDVYQEDGKRYHLLKPGHVNTCSWVVLCSRGDLTLDEIPEVQIEGESVETDEYSVAHSILNHKD